jgi:two-component system sensor histidine kinase YesM
MMKRAWLLEMNNWPIRYKLILHFMLISIVPSFLLGLLVSYTVTRIIDDQVNDHTLQIIGKVNTSLEHVISNMQNVTYFVAFDPNVRQFLSGQELDAEEMYTVSRFLQGFTTLYPEVAGILVADRNGSYLSNDMYARTDVPLTAELWYQQAVESRGIFTIVGHPENRNVTTHTNYSPSEVVSVVRAILEPDTQRVQGVVLVDLKLRVIAETAKDVRLGKTGYLMVIDHKGENIYAPANPIINRVPIEWFSDQPSGTFSREVNGRSLQFIYLTSPFTNWTTVGVFPTHESAAEVREIQFYVVSFVFLICVMGITASLYVSHSISRPLQQLQSFMHKAESGDLTVRLTSNRQDEIGMLGRSFNKMLVQLRRLLELTELQERQKREAELKSLQAHIKPHFLYNTLDTIHWLARRKGADDVAEVVESLSRLFRIGLSRGNEMIPLMDEIEHIRSYLKIQKTRYRDKLNYTIEIDPSVQHLEVLKIVFQPIVENAIYHGLKQRRGPGNIRIAAKREGYLLLLIVEDDGIGMTSEQLAELRAKLDGAGTGLSAGGGQSGHAQPGPSGEGGKMGHVPPALSAASAQTGPIQPAWSAAGGQSGHSQSTVAGSGYGIVNVQARVKLSYGDEYGVKVESRYGEGTTVTIVHPIIEGGRSGGETRESHMEGADRR